MGKSLNRRRAWAPRIAVVALAAVVSAGAYALPNLSLAPINPDFGTGAPGVQRDIILVLTNVSAGNVELGGGANVGIATGGVAANWSVATALVQPCTSGLVLAPNGTCNWRLSVIQSGPGVSNALINFTQLVIGGDETFALEAIARATIPAPVPALAPAILALLAGALGTLGAFVLRRRRR